jgi:hypothetical protein
MADSTEHNLELTTSALKDGPADLGIHGGLIEISRWEGWLDETHAPAFTEIGALLVELRGELESDEPTGTTIADLMRRLSESVLGVSVDLPEGELRSRLRELGNLLEQTAPEAE